MKTKKNSNLIKTLNKEEIYNLYVVEKKPRKEIASILGISTSTLSRFIKNNNIPRNTRNFENEKIREEIKLKIIELCNSGISKTKALKMCRINSDTYNKIFKSESLSTIYKNSINNSLIDINNKDFCYLLGIFISDGHMDNKCIYISQSDAPFLHKLQKIFEHTGKLYKVSNNIPNICYSFHIVSSKLRDFLSSYKITSNKKLNAPYIECGSLEKHFIRGLLDGDGCLYYNYTSGKFQNKRLELSTSSPYIRDGYIKFLNKHNIECTVHEQFNVNVNYKIFISKIDDIIYILNIIYENKGEAFLDRKFYNYIKFKKLVEINRQVNDIVGSTCNDVE